MTQDEIIEMARHIATTLGSRMCDENGDTHGEELYCMAFDDIVDSIKLVAAKEREIASKVASKAILNAVENERELCAKVCDTLESNDADFDSHHWNQATQRCGYAIRARGDA